MKKSNLWSLRLGFSGKEAAKIEKLGLEKFLKHSYDSKFDREMPGFLQDLPKTTLELKQVREFLKTADPETKKELQKKENRSTLELKKWWISKMRNDEFPLRQNMV